MVSPSAGRTSRKAVAPFLTPLFHLPFLSFHFLVHHFHNITNVIMPAWAVFIWQLPNHALVVICGLVRRNALKSAVSSSYSLPWLLELLNKGPHSFSPTGAGVSDRDDPLLVPSGLATLYSCSCPFVPASDPNF